MTAGKVNEGFEKKFQEIQATRDKFLQKNKKTGWIFTLKRVWKGGVEIGKCYGMIWWKVGLRVCA